MVASIALLIGIIHTPQEIRQRAQTVDSSPPQCKATNGVCRNFAVGCYPEETDSSKLDCGEGQTCCSLIVPPQCAALNGICEASSACSAGDEVVAGKLDCPGVRVCCTLVTPPKCKAQNGICFSKSSCPSERVDSGQMDCKDSTLTCCTQPVPTAVPIPTAIPVATIAPTKAPLPTLAPTIKSLPTLTAPIAPKTTSLFLTVYIHGIGNSGDNLNVANVLSNKNPLRRVRDFTVQIDNAPGQFSKTQTVPFTYELSAGYFTAKLDIGPELTTGVYEIKIKTDSSFMVTIPSQTITAGGQIAIPQTTLATGDINGDNVLDTLDYNTIISCYDVAVLNDTCTSAKKQQSDLNDDGLVNGVDYNLFLREMIRK